MNDNAELIELLRKQNKSLRRVNKHLRRALKESREYSDSLFLELCDSDIKEGLSDTED